MWRFCILSHVEDEGRGTRLIFHLRDPATAWWWIGLHSSPPLTAVFLRNISQEGKSRLRSSMVAVVFLIEDVKLALLARGRNEKICIIVGTRTTNAGRSSCVAENIEHPPTPK
jgi:hypothetical protein